MKSLAVRLVLVLGVLTLAACATNPVTGRRQLTFMSEANEIALGRDSDASIVAQYGLVDDPALQAYVESIGERMVPVSHRPDLDFHFRVLDDPIVNAFALPGGYTYVTRGILAHLNSEAALAGVMGHEIGHVTAKHGVTRMTHAQLMGLGLAVGSAVSETFARYSGLAGAAGQLLLLKYGRDDERQSDELGVQYATAIGYDTHDMAEFFETLDRLRPPGGAIPSWMSTHPDPGERWHTVHRLTDAAQAGKPGPFEVGRERYLRMIDGLKFGADPQEGFFADGMFHHPQMRLRFPVPPGWQGQNSKSQVVIFEPEQKAVVFLRLADAATAEEAAAAWLNQPGVTVLEQHAARVGGRPAVRTVVEATQDGTTQVAISHFFQWGDVVLALHGLTTRAALPTFGDAIETPARGFAEETDPEILGLQPVVVKVIESPGGSFSRIVRNYAVPEGAGIDGVTGLAILNGVEVNTTIPAGQLVKVLVRAGS